MVHLVVAPVCVCVRCHGSTNRLAHCICPVQSGRASARGSRATGFMCQLLTGHLPGQSQGMPRVRPVPVIKGPRARSAQIILPFGDLSLDSLVHRGERERGERQRGRAREKACVRIRVAASRPSIWMFTFYCPLYWSIDDNNCLLIELPDWMAPN